MVLTFLASLTHHLSMVKFAEKKSMLENFRANVLNQYQLSCFRPSSETHAQGQIAETLSCFRPSSETHAQGPIAETRGSLNGRKEMATKKSIVPDQFQTVGIILNSDWCQKFFVFFCPIRGQQAVKSFRVFLHGNHLIAILALVRSARVCSRVRNVSLKSQHEMYRESFRISVEIYAGPFTGIVTVAYFQVCEICLKMSSPIYLK